MRLFDHGILGAVGVLTLLCAVPVGAQENLDQGKSAVQLFASDCAICHKSPQALGKAGGLFGLESFLRQHYTASRESAAAISKYLQAISNAPPEPTKRSRRSTKSSDKDKRAAKKPVETKTDDGKSKATKPSEAKPVESKPAEAKPAEAKPAEMKPSEAQADPKATSRAAPDGELKANATKSEPKEQPKAEPKSETNSAAPAKQDKVD